MKYKIIPFLDFNDWWTSFHYASLYSGPLHHKSFINKNKIKFFSFLVTVDLNMRDLISI